MRHFQKIADGVNTAPLLNQIIRHPELWNAHPIRTTCDGTPFGEADDILIRYSPLEEAKMKDGFMGSMNTVWYPARDVLTEVIPIIRGLMATMGAYALDRVIISRMKPGSKILPHIDDGCEYTRQHNIARMHVCLQGLPGANFYCGDLPKEDGETEEERAGSIECANMRCGEVWWFNAHKAHWVVNESADDRIHLLVDLRTFA